MRYLGGGVGHHHVDIPPEEEEVPERGTDDEEFPASISIPDTVVPVVPLEPPARPEDRVSSIDGGEERDSDEEDDDNPDSDEEPEAHGEGGEGEELDLGHEDGDGEVPDEVGEGYAPL